MSKRLRTFESVDFNYDFLKSIENDAGVYDLTNERIQRISDFMWDRSIYDLKYLIFAEYKVVENGTRHVYHLEHLDLLSVDLKFLLSQMEVLASSLMSLLIIQQFYLYLIVVRLNPLLHWHYYLVQLLPFLLQNLFQRYLVLFSYLKIQVILIISMRLVQIEYLRTQILLHRLLSW
jgi:hypothetical protein